MKNRDVYPFHSEFAKIKKSDKNIDVFVSLVENPSL